MSWQESTKKVSEVNTIVKEMIESTSIDDNVEILVYLEDGEWIITKDRKFFSLGYKLEDVIITQQKEIKNLQNEIASLKTTIGQLHVQLIGQQNTLCPTCKYPKWNCKCFVNLFDWNKITCK